MKSPKRTKKPGAYLASNISYVEKENSAEFMAAAHYVCVYMLDAEGNYSYIYGAREVFDNYFTKNLKTNSVHECARETAFNGKRVSYDWFDNAPVPTFFNTVAIPLSDGKGKIASVLFIIKALDELMVRQSNSMIVAEKAGQSFVHIIMKAREEEKRLITSAIHDQLGNFSIRTHALIELLKEDIISKSTKKSLESLKDLQDAVRESVHAMKEIITSMRPLQLDSVGLNAAIKELLEKVAQTEAIKIKYSYKIKDKTLLSKNTELVLYRVVQEALSNTVKYAKAKTLTVELKEDRTKLFLTVSDDGIGFKPQAHRSVKNLGLAGMQENIASLKGTMKLKSKIGKGTTIIVTCPKFNYTR